MTIESEDLKFNFGCRSCGYKSTAPDAPLGQIPVSRVIEKLDACFNKNDMDGAGRLLTYWQTEAEAQRDRRGELSIVNEMLGYYRKTGDTEKALWAVDRSRELLQLLHLEKTLSGATVLLNTATTLKACGNPEKAMPLYDETFAIYVRELDETDARFGGYYNNKALTLVDLGQYEQAEACYQKALAIMETVENGLPDCAVTQINRAHLYEAWKGIEAPEIAACLESAEQYLNDASVDRNGYYAYVCDKCAPSFDYFGYFALAAELKERAKNIYERA